MVATVDAAVEYIQQQTSIKPQIGIILGSGLSAVADKLTAATSIPYQDIPGFPRINVLSHKSELRIGTIGDTTVACMLGRAHPYEGHSMDVIKHYIRTLSRLGCDTIILTNAAGGMHTQLSPGSLVLLKDHINLQPVNPLMGPNDDEFGPRFLSLDEAYDVNLRERLLSAALNLKITVHEGVYVAVSGPNYETAAEIKAFKVMGGDVVGMSTVPEVLVARHCGLKVMAMSVVTNYATGLNAAHHSHEEVVKAGHEASMSLSKLLVEFLSSYAGQDA